MRTVQFSNIIAKQPGLDDRCVRGIATREIADRDGDILSVAGADLSEFQKNPIALFAHDPQKPIARVTLEKRAYEIVATLQFPPPGVSKFADEILGLVKSRVLGALSVGFLPLESKPIPGGGYRFEKWKMLELSVVAIPSNPDAVIIERSLLADRKRKGVLFPGVQKTRAQRLRVLELKKRECDDGAKTQRERIAEVSQRIIEAGSTVTFWDGAPLPEYVFNATKSLERQALRRSSQHYDAHNPPTRADRLREIERRRR